MSLLAPFPVLTHVLGTLGFVALIPLRVGSALAFQAVGTQDESAVIVSHPKLLCWLFFQTFRTYFTFRQYTEQLVDMVNDFFASFGTSDAIKAHRDFTVTYQISTRHRMVS